MKEPCWTQGRGKQGGSQAIVLPSAVENHLRLISVGQWFFDVRSRMMYYFPRPLDNLATAKVIAGSVDTLVLGTGVRDVTIQDTTFSYATWLRPSSGDGFIEVQANYVLIPSGGYTAPGSVHYEASHNLVVQNCRFEHLGAQGLVITGGSTNCRVVGNYFTDISGSGVRTKNFKFLIFLSYLEF
jgi:hypothetical protein